jgi:Raf kinase inhibitor-like YbhB/YbcL family protein
MKIISHSFNHLGIIPGEYAFAVKDPKEHIQLSTNKNPHLGWHDAPVGTQSFVLVCHDSDVPSSGENVNQEGKVVEASLPRVDFYHWLLINIPASVHEIEAGSHSSGITAKGKAAASAPIGKHGINDYTAWFNGDEQMGGDYYGYDGPCPPWNDAIKHHYHFTIYALDVPQLNLPTRFTGPELLAALDGHVLQSASITGIYSLNPTVKL